MPEWNFTASKLFCNANKLIEAYQTVLQPLCKELGMPPMVVDILMFFANNPDSSTAKDLCQCRGLKPGIVSVHIDRLVNEGRPFPATGGSSSSSARRPRSPSLKRAGRCKGTLPCKFSPD